MNRSLGFAAAALALGLSLPASAQRQPPSPEQRLERLEKQVQQMQRQVFPRGRPADTAGFADDPAASQSSVVTLAQRLDALERQMADLTRLAEENGNALRTLQADLASARSDTDTRIASIERKLAEVAAAPPTANHTPPTTSTEPPKPRPRPTLQPTTGGTLITPEQPLSDPAEDAYTVGFKQWEAGDHAAAIRSLRAFVAAYPAHRRVSYANNLIGRALLDQGEARAATEVLLANYRKNPKGERAPDSLYYLGQALMKLGQPGQACKAYAELNAVYGAKIRPELKKLATDAQAEARC